MGCCSAQTAGTKSTTQQKPTYTTEKDLQSNQQEKNNSNTVINNSSTNQQPQNNQPQQTPNIPVTESNAQNVDATLQQKYPKLFPIPPELFEKRNTLIKPDIAQLKSAFRQTDRDSSNNIDVNEIKKYFKQININYSDQQINAMLSVVDDNKNKRFEQQEFFQVAYILQNMGSSNMKEHTMFLNADKDFSGTISFKEFQLIIKQIGWDKGETENKKYLFSNLCKSGEDTVHYHVFCYAMEKLGKK